MKRARIAVPLMAAGALLVGVCAVAVATTNAHHSKSEPEHLRALERSRLHALVAADTDTTRKLTATDFQLIDPSGEVSSREEYLDSLASGLVDYRALEPTSPIQVRLFQHMAVLRYRASFDLVVGGDTHVAHQGWITETYERRDGRWQITAEQATAVPNDLALFVESISSTS